jgi:hypothetical protein
MNNFNEVCGNCGLTFGAHRGDSICHNQCPEHEGSMDWNMEHITVFKSTGNYKEVKSGTERKSKWTR